MYCYPIIVYLTLCLPFYRGKKPSYGGYDYKFVGKTPEKYICSICTKAFRDAHLAVCCGQHFCASCLTHWTETQRGRKTCPQCRQEDFQHVLNKAIIREVNELNIHCTNSAEGEGDGCKWVGEIGALSNHLESDKGCEYVEVSCTNKGCGKRMKRKELENHANMKCYKRPYECEHCGHRDTYFEITGSARNYFSTTSHYDECPKFPLPCPNECGVRDIKREEIPEHRSSCPLEPLDCPFKDAGCTKKITRQEMDIHMTANIQQHMLIIFETHQQAHQQLKRDTCLLKSTLAAEMSNLETSLQNALSETTAQSLQNMKSILQENLNAIGDLLYFRVTNFTQLRNENKPWHSPPFSIAGKLHVQSVVHPNGVGRGQGSHMSVSLLLVAADREEDDSFFEYNVIITAKRTSKTLMLCTKIPSKYPRAGGLIRTLCSYHFHLPSPGEVLRSEEQFLEISDTYDLLENDSIILQLKLSDHKCRLRYC